MTELRNDRNEFRYEIRCVIRCIITELRNDMNLIVIEFWWAYWFDLLPIIEGEDLGRWCTDLGRY